MADLTRIALRLAYLGKGFAGWQRQAAQRTVQGELESALARLYGQAVTAIGASRTDAGVHASGQVAHFDPPFFIPLPSIRAALKGLLPGEVRVMHTWQAPSGFHARASARGKRYRYRLAWGKTLEPWEALRRFECHARLNTHAMAGAAEQILGTHDFANFASTGHSGIGVRGTTRTISSVTWRERGRLIDIIVEGDGFLRGMVRRLVGALVEIGRGAQEPAWLGALLSGIATSPNAPTAAAVGLTLERVFYKP